MLLQIIIYGDGEIEANREHAHLVSLECCKFDVPLLVTQKLQLLDFESRKDAAQVLESPALNECSTAF